MTRPLPHDLPSPAADRRRRDVGVALTIFAVAILVRLSPMLQSLWYDEMFTLIHYVAGPWGNVVAGQYSPNNHTLFTILAKLVTPENLDLDTTAFFARLPSLLAGSLAPIALAWPLRRERPVAALLVAAIAALHPWLVSSSAFARGYALLLLLAVLSTHALPKKKRLIDGLYSALLSAMVYTQPLGVGAAVGHGATVFLLRRELFWTWFRSAALAGVVTIFLYLPMVMGAKDYWSRPEKPSLTYTQFLDQVFRHAQAGQDLPGLVYLATPLLVLIAGGLLAWRNNLLRPTLVTFAVASLFGLLVPLAVPLAGEVRALHWLIPLYCLAAAALFTAPLPNKGFRWVSAAAAFLLLVTFGLRIHAISTVPAQPIREAAARARALAPPGSRVIGLYMASDVARALYGGIDSLAYTLHDRPATNPKEQTLPGLLPLEAASPAPPVVVVFYESFLHRDEPELWDYLQSNYTLLERLPGRISPAAIYRRKPTP